MTGTILYGRIGTTTLHFEYGDDANTFERWNADRLVPPTLTNYIVDVDARALNRTLFYATNWRCTRPGRPQTQGQLALRLWAPFALDRNHIDSVDPIRLFLVWRFVLNGHGYGNVATSEAINLRDSRIEVGFKTSKVDAIEDLLATAINTAADFDSTGSPMTANVCDLTGPTVDTRALDED